MTAAALVTILGIVVSVALAVLTWRIFEWVEFRRKERNALREEPTFEVRVLDDEWAVLKVWSTADGTHEYLVRRIAEDPGESVDG